jgi:cytidylate kinase
MSVPVITIDGPSGSGKGTISRQLADLLDWHFLDSGALYRLTALGARKNNISLDDEARLAGYARDLPIRFENRGPQEEPGIYLSNEDVTSQIRTEEAGNAASKVAALMDVRQALLERQRSFRQPPGLVADGRDMGTTVFPDAELKIFLTASAEERAQRRYKQLSEKGISVSLAALVEEIAERDARDQARKASPLKPASDAAIIDTSEIGIEEVMTRVRSLCKEKLNINCSESSRGNGG